MKITHAVKTMVSAYLMTKAHAEVVRKKIDKINREILEECPIYADKHGDEDRRQILESKHLYLCSDKALLEDFYEESHKRYTEAGFDVKPGYSPALIAENMLVNIEHQLIEAASKMFPGITVNKLLCAGLETYHKYIDLLCKAVINSPGFTKPKLKV